MWFLLIRINFVSLPDLFLCIFNMFWCHVFYSNSCIFRILFFCFFVVSLVVLLISSISVEVNQFFFTMSHLTFASLFFHFSSCLKYQFCVVVLWFVLDKRMLFYLCTPHVPLQIPNSLEQKFSHWDSQYETLITHYEKKTQKPHKIFLILRKSCLTDNISNRTLNFISKWVGLFFNFCNSSCFLSCKEQ